MKLEMKILHFVKKDPVRIITYSLVDLTAVTSINSPQVCYNCSKPEMFLVLQMLHSTAKFEMFTDTCMGPLRPRRPVYKVAKKMFQKVFFVFFRTLNKIPNIN